MAKKIIIDYMIWALVKKDSFLMLYELIDTFVKVDQPNINNKKL